MKVLPIFRKEYFLKQANSLTPVSSTNQVVGIQTGGIFFYGGTLPSTQILQCKLVF